jgi:hypothetical protein
MKKQPVEQVLALFPSDHKQAFGDQSRKGDGIASVEEESVFLPRQAVPCLRAFIIEQVGLETENGRFHEMVLCGANVAVQTALSK